MFDLTMKDHPMIKCVVPEEREAVADLSVSNDNREVSFMCDFPGCTFVFKITPLKRLDTDAWCENREFKK